MVVALVTVTVTVIATATATAAAEMVEVLMEEEAVTEEEAEGVTEEALAS